MAVHNNNAAIFLTKSALPSAFSLPYLPCKTNTYRHGNDNNNNDASNFDVDFRRSVNWRRQRTGGVRLVYALGAGNVNSGGGGGDLASSKNKSVPNSNYVVPMDKSFASSSYITRPLIEILRDLNKRIPDNIIKPHSSSTLIPWYHANRMLSFYAPGWCGEIRDVIFSENGSVTVVYRVTIRGSDGEAHRESTGTVSPSDGHVTDPVAAAEELAFCRACSRFGLGLYLYHEE